MSLQEFFKGSLAVDWLEADEESDEPIFILAPAIDGETPGEEYPGRPIGRCVLLTEDGKCSIHATKPRECALAHHDHTKKEATATHIEIGRMWKDHQQQVRDLLGREPETAPMPYSPFFGLLGLFGATE